MLFNSTIFFVFFAIVLSCYYVLKLRWQNRMLLIASYVFYGWWDWRFLTLIAFSTVLDYFCGLKIYSSENPRTRKNALILSLVGNLGVLGFFKYFGFFADSLSNLFDVFGFSASYTTLNIVLPVGISFYTFQTMSYTIDIYSKKLKPTKDFLNFALFVAYFPQLVAGPIERARNLLPEIEAKRKVTAYQFREGIELMIIGMFKKVALADMAGSLFVDPVFSNPGQYGGVTLFFASCMFGLQIYGDFSGYSDMARGVSKLLGIELMVNFNQPYFSAGFSEFWGRWHISLSTWLRDYLYIALGGNRGTQFMTYRNLILTMLLGGLWHGASWNFVIWGACHGTALSIERAVRQHFGIFANKVTGLSRLRRVMFVFVIVTLIWIPFRAPSIHESISILSGILSLRDGLEFAMNDYGIAALLVAGLFLVDVPQILLKEHAFARRLPGIVGDIVLAIFLAATLLVPVGNQTFIYFQF
ncbi:MAG: MBOAT family protein [Candidatus Lindowbacteria bacterium]|nr:MBOAT family protein [Candidatus Lindowbacteria bacterium]